MRTLRQRARRGQAIVEFSLTLVLLLIFLLGVIDFSWLFTTRSQAFQATRNAARYAAVNPTAWSNDASPGANTIEGQLQTPTVKVPNNDAHISITYWVPGSSPSGTQCGHYSAASNKFVADNGYTEAQCLAVGDFVSVSATYPYNYITPLLAGTFGATTISAVAQEQEEQPCSGC